MNERRARISRYIARQMKSAREARGFKKAEIAREMGIKRDTYAKYESLSFTSWPDASALFIFCEVTGASVLDIMPTFGGDW